jgi:MFS superfamily sulfate permease-like transporter
VQAILQKRNITFEMTDAAKAGLALGAAFLATVILTKDYFGIAASGNTALEMLKSYRSNGFHANWRGVLYGTITLVIMITWPRKFRTFKKYLPAPLMALLIPLVINMALNREAYRTPVYETGEYALTQLSQLFDFSANAHPLWMLPLLAIGFCICLFTVQAFFGASKQESAGYAVGNTLSSAVCLPLRGYEFGKTGAFGCIVGALSVAALSFAFPLVSRMPTHSMAVVLITLGWQSVPWGLIGKSFKSGAKDITALLLVFLCFVFADPVLAFLPPFVSFFDKRKI